MPYKEKEIERLYYPIGEVAKMFRVSVSHIRFWEKEFAILKPKKNKKGNRLFTKQDVENLKKIYHLVKEKGYTLEGAKRALRDKDAVEEFSDSIQNKDQLISTLKKVKAFLEQTRQEL